jgi:hypothetical protein
VIRNSANWLKSVDFAGSALSEVMPHADRANQRIFKDRYVGDRDLE